MPGENFNAISLFLRSATRSVGADQPMNVALGICAGITVNFIAVGIAGMEIGGGFVRAVAELELYYYLAIGLFFTILYQKCRSRQTPEEFIKCMDTIEEINERGEISEIDKVQAYRKLLQLAVMQVARPTERALKADDLVEEVSAKEK